MLSKKGEKKSPLTYNLNKASTLVKLLIQNYAENCPKAKQKIYFCTFKDQLSLYTRIEGIQQKFDMPGLL